MNNLRLNIAKRVTDIPRKIWDGLFPAGLIEGYGYYRALDESNLPGFAIYYAVVYKDNDIAAVAPFFTVDFSFETTIQGALRRAISSVRKRFPGFLNLRMLFFGSPLTEEWAIGISRGCAVSEVLDFLLKETAAFCKAERIAVITFYNLTGRDSAVMDYLAKKGFASMEAFPLARLHINEKSLEEYIQNLGPSTRKDIRRKLRKARESADIRFEERKSLDGLLDAAYALYLNNLNKSDVSFEKLTPEYFAKVAENMPGVARFFITWVNNKLAAFNLLFVKDDFCIDKYIGFDYDVAHKHSLYFLTWCHNIDWCIKNNIRYYQPGTCDYDPKIRLGGNLVPLYISTRLINPYLNFFTKPVLKLIEPKRFDPVLKNLKRYEKKAAHV